MIQDKIKTLVLADLHLGVLPVRQTYKELEYLLEYIEDDFFDLIVIAGDFFDKKLYAGEEYIVFANEIIQKMMKHSKYIRIVHGTSSHDNKQYSIFKHYEAGSNKFRIIYSVEEEKFEEGFRVLYLPEEYIYDKKEYYKEYFEEKKRYNYVFGHGIIQEAMTNAVRGKKKTRSHTKPAVFTTAELEDICKGQVYFGHYHIHTNIHDKVFYVGSYSRDKFGEEEPKGFYELEYDGENYTNHFVENIKTEQYVTIAYPYSHTIFQKGTDLVEEFDRIKKKKKKTGIEHLRLIFNIPDDYPDAEFLIKLATDTFRGDGYKVEITNGYIETKKNINHQSFEEVREKLNYVLDTNATIENTISSFAKDQLQKEVSPEKVKEYLNFKAIDILYRG